MKLPYKRFVRQVSTGAPRPKSTYLALMAENAEALKTAEWREATPLDAALVPHDFTRATFLSDEYDAFKMTGAFSTATQAETAFAGMAAYRFKLPDAYTAQNATATITSLSLKVSRDRFCRKGLRIAYELNDETTPSTDWDALRGEPNPDGQAVLDQSSVANLTSSSAAETTLSFALSAESTRHQYLWVYVSLEDYEDRWTMYDEKEKRQYAIEGSGMVVGDSVDVEFSGDVAADPPAEPTPTTIFSGGTSPTWLQPLPAQNAGSSAPQIAADAEAIDTFFTPAVVKETPSIGTWTINGSINVSDYQKVSGSTAMTDHPATIDYSVEFSFAPTASHTVSAKITCVVTQDGASTTYGPQTMLEYSGSGGSVLGFMLDWRFSHTTGNQFIPFDPGHPEMGGSNVSARVLWGFHFYATPPIISAAGNGAYLVSTNIKRFIRKVDDVSSPSYDAWNNTTSANSSRYDAGTASSTVQLSTQETLHWMLQTVGGVPSVMDACSAPSVSSRYNLPCTKVGDSSPWSFSVDGRSFTVSVSGNSVTLTDTAASQSWPFTLSGETTGQSYFDPSVSLRLGNDAVRDYGLAAALGDLSSAIATFEAGTQPSGAELLGRLIRNSRRASGAMMYLHPLHGALADELDVMRPVPRFFRASTAPTGQDSCQPGLSVWFKRGFSEDNNTITLVGSSASRSYIYDGGAKTASVVANPVFLQCALLAVRAPSAADAGARLVLKNVNTTGTPAVGVAVHNDFALRCAVWASPANEWDGSNAFALAAMGSMPSVYRCDGDDSVVWSVDCGGRLMPFGPRTVTARRIGVSPLVSGDIAAEAEIAIPLSGGFGEGDVILIAPAVEGFASGGDGPSAYFGRQSDPANVTTGWARYASDLGWFPEVKLLT